MTYGRDQRHRKVPASYSRVAVSGRDADASSPDSHDFDRHYDTRYGCSGSQDPEATACKHVWKHDSTVGLSNTK